MRATYLCQPLFSLVLLPGCYLFASAEIKETCEDLPAGCEGAAPSVEDLDGDGMTEAEGDCDDGDPSIFLGAPDAVGDGVDNDCDGLDGVDADGDRFASTASGGEDCDDADPAISPAALERCDAGGVDEDCDGLVNDDDPGVQGTQAFFVDADGDGFGDASTTAEACAAPSGFVESPGDCDDNRAAVNPGEPEICGDGLDNDCDGWGGCRPIEAGRAVGSAEGFVASTTPEDGYALSAAAVPRGSWLAIGGPTASDYAGGTAVFGFSSGEGGALESSLIGLVRGTESGEVGGGVLLAPVLRGGGLGLVTLGGNGTLAIFDPADLRGTSSLTVADAVAKGAELVPGSPYEGRPLVAGDLTGDGVAELIVGAGSSSGEGYSGAAYVVRGGAVGTITPSSGYAGVLGTLSGSYNFGYSVQLADLDGDGLLDLAVADPWAYLEDDPVGGGVVALFGGDGLRGLLDARDADARLLPSEGGEYLGWDLSAFDLDGDGRTELGVVAPGLGRTLVFSGLGRGVRRSSEADATFNGKGYYDALGVNAGDIDGDGNLDLVVSGMYNELSEQTGKLHAVYGPLAWGWTELEGVPDVIYGDGSGFLFGYRTVLSDLDGDGGLDIAARSYEGVHLFRGGGF